MKDTTCKHFTGIGQDCCAAGVRYDDHPDGLACLMLYGKRRGHCDKLEFLTPEELAKEEADMAEFMGKIEKATRFVNQFRKKRNRGFVFTKDCPACGAPDALRFSFASNMHARVRCLTQGCVQWIE